MFNLMLSIRTKKVTFSFKNPTPILVEQSIDFSSSMVEIHKNDLAKWRGSRQQPAVGIYCLMCLSNRTFSFYFGVGAFGGSRLLC